MITLRCLVNDKSSDPSIYLAEHGVAFAIEAPDGPILFDTGQSGDVLLHNAERMGVDLNRIKALALSHAHFDHTGGLGSFMKYKRSITPLYAHPDIFRKRYTLHNGELLLIGPSYQKKYLVSQVIFRLSAEPIEIIPGIWTTGEIHKRPYFEGRSPQHYIKKGETIVPDPYRDDLSLVIQSERGLVVVCGCCHAGLLNTLEHIRQRFQRPIYSIIGGAHLISAKQHDLEMIVSKLQDLSGGDLPDLYLNHCTGERAIEYLKQAFPGQVNPCEAGAVLRIDK